MTLANALIVICLIALPIAAFVVYGAYARLDLDRLNSYQEWCDTFFSLAKHSLSEDIPQEWIGMLETLNNNINHEHAAFIVYCAFSRSGKSVAQLSTDEVLYLESNPDKAERFTEACRAGFLAMSYNHLFWGVKARSLMTDNFARPSKPSNALRDMEQVGRTFHRLAAA